MGSAELIVALLVIGAPLALFLCLRSSGRPRGTTGDGAAAGDGGTVGPDRAKPPADYGLGRESSAAPAAQTAVSEPDAAARAGAAAAAGGALILAAGFARSHSGEAGAETPHMGHSGGGPDSGDGGSGDGDGGAGGGGDGGGD